MRDKNKERWEKENTYSRFNLYDQWAGRGVGAGSDGGSGG